MSTEKSIVNISCYKFVALHDTKMLRERFKQVCGEIGLRGSVVLSHEGINVMLAGSRQQINQFADFLAQDPRFAGIKFKESLSEEIPFWRLRIKLKASLVPSPADLNPQIETAANLPPKELKKWLDDGREFTLLDTRNDYEIELGTFDKAIDFDLDQFSEIGDELAAMDKETKEKPIVMFCTGGIRCEKGAPMARRAGFKDVYQLEGGILKYFEECGSEHYHGGCFVFDQRVVVDASLSE